MHETLREAYEQHYAPLVRLCGLLCGRREVAEDIVQEAFVRAARRLEELDPERVGAYLRHVAVNLWKNRLRRLAVERRFRAVDPISATDSIAALEDRDVLWHALTRLSARQRACLVLRFYEDLPERAVAEVMGCSIGTVKSHTARALARLRKELSDEP